MIRRYGKVASLVVLVHVSLLVFLPLLHEDLFYCGSGFVMIDDRVDCLECVDDGLTKHVR